MKVETKYNIGDKFWFMIDNKPQQLTVEYINISSWHEPRDNYGSIKVVQITYTTGGGHARKYQVLESEFYKTKEELLATL